MVTADDWRARLDLGEVLDEVGRALVPDAPCPAGQRLWYWRQVAGEPVLPFDLPVLHQDEHLVVVDKPHFMTVAPVGRHARETALARLQRQLGLDSLTPVHRLDRDTAGVLLFSVRPQDRATYQALFASRQVAKRYEAVSASQPGASPPTDGVRCSRVVPSGRPMQMEEVSGEANAHTRIAVRWQRDGRVGWALWPQTGRTHQLRVHLNALGWPILNDRIYPVLLPEEPPGCLPDLDMPLQLLARELRFTDPVSGQERHFVSQRQLACWTDPTAEGGARDSGGL